MFAFSWSRQAHSCLVNRFMGVVPGVSESWRDCGDQWALAQYKKSLQYCLLVVTTVDWKAKCNVIVRSKKKLSSHISILYINVVRIGMLRKRNNYFFLHVHPSHIYNSLFSFISISLSSLLFPFSHSLSHTGDQFPRNIVPLLHVRGYLR